MYRGGYIVTVGESSGCERTVFTVCTRVSYPLSLCVRARGESERECESRGREKSKMWSQAQLSHCFHPAGSTCPVSWQQSSPRHTEQVPVDTS